MSKKCTILCALVLSVFTVSQYSLNGGDGANKALLINDLNIDRYFSEFYEALGDETPKPEIEVFKNALTGFFNLKAENKVENNLLTIIDFSISSKQERMWVVDMLKMEVVHFSLVAHGRNSGEEFAGSFSNKPSSYQSSLGFYLTDKIYHGRHGMSLYLDGIEPGINDKARERTIVMHSADYVSKDFIRWNGRLGRSFGCPAIPIDNHEKVIKLLSGKSCIYIHYPDEEYFSKSSMFTLESAKEGIAEYLTEIGRTFEIYKELLTVTEDF
jgi:hypothetical protein